MAKKKINPRYIDANLVKDALLGWETEPTDEEIEYAIDNIPTADVAEVKHGKWEVSKYVLTEGMEKLPIEYACSLCGKGVHFHKTNYCSYCGAKMDGGNL